METLRMEKEEIRVEIDGNGHAAVAGRLQEGETRGLHREEDPLSELNRTPLQTRPISAMGDRALAAALLGEGAPITDSRM
jgi:hypothetical protein